MVKFLFYWSLFISLAWTITCLPPTLFGDDPFSVIWNGASEKCLEHFGIGFNFSAYNIEDNTGDSFHGDKMVIFYKDELGKYPRVLWNGTKLNGGIPQLAPFEKHLNTTTLDINNLIPNESFPGLAVIDWESWRPLYVHNFDSKKIYQTLSKELVRQKHMDWNNHEIIVKAKRDFDKAAKRFMLSTLSRASSMRPNGRWGFYGFPRCYKHNCHRVRFDNNRLGWMFSASSGLYPSLYLKHHEDSWLEKVHFVSKTLHETIRVFRRFTSANKTVIVPYTRFRYADPEQFYDQTELLITMAMSALKGSAGVILWDSSINFEEEKLCRDMQGYLTRTLGPFVVTLTNFLKKCSQERCNSRGRCVEKRAALLQPGFLSHLIRTTSRLWRAVQDFVYKQYPWWNHRQNRTTPRFSVSYALQNFEYRCQCYPGWNGNSCNISSEI